MTLGRVQHSCRRGGSGPGTGREPCCRTWHWGRLPRASCERSCSNRNQLHTRPALQNGDLFVSDEAHYAREVPLTAVPLTALRARGLLGIAAKRYNGRCGGCSRPQWARLFKQKCGGASPNFKAKTPWGPTVHGGDRRAVSRQVSGLSGRVPHSSQRVPN